MQDHAPLKRNAIGYASSVVIGVASTAPGYSLAAVLGLIVAVGGIGVHAPGVLIVSFVPMLLVALGYKYLNKADPDAGTTFAWATRAFGPMTGWMGGWAIIVADLIVMANLAQIAGLYSFLLFGVEAPSTLAVTAVGVVWIAIMTAVCVIGVEVNARTQRWLLAAEIVTLAAFAVVALVRVGLGDGALTPSLDWFSPFAVGSVGALTSGLLVAIFIYWGWDTLVCVNEETEDAETVPGKAAVMSVLILVGIYVIVATAASAAGAALARAIESAVRDVGRIVVCVDAAADVSTAMMRILSSGEPKTSLPRTESTSSELSISCFGPS